MAENLVHIGEVIVNGVLFDPKNTEAWSKLDVEALYRAPTQLFNALDERGIHYMLVGEIATLAYVEGRNTQHIDLIVADDDLPKAPELHVKWRNADVSHAQFGDLRVNVFSTDAFLVQHVLARHHTIVQFTETRLWCATVEGLILMTLYFLPSLYRDQQFGRARSQELDVAAMIRAYRPDMTPLFEQLKKYMIISDFMEVRKIVAEIEESIAKERQRFPSLLETLMRLDRDYPLT